MADRAHFVEEWRGFDGVFGGRVIAALGEAAQCIPGFEVLSLAVEFSGSVGLGDADLLVSPRHQGGRTACVEVSLLQGRPRARAVAKLARVRGAEIPSAPIDLAGILTPEQTPRYDPPYRDQPWSRLLELRLIPDTGAGRATRAWMRLNEPARPVATLDALGRAAVLIDAVPPGLFLSPRVPAFVPTIDFTLHLRPQPPAPRDGWYLVVSSTVWARDDFCMEDTSLYTSMGEMVAQARQNRRVVWPADVD
ncbi:thioesterase family protein [Micromonospora sp. CP22]|uniref:thioesterase family protein n=1 Tax=Micromonospora sp. CP22 TaxID=2580517 RepID=UPI0018AD2237|nr:thioesterase family protein [Micromonospora sp. CP22]